MARTKRQFCFECHAERVVKVNSKATLCWDCKKATGGSDCPWANNFEPVEGWDAIPEMITVTTTVQTSSFQVNNCPLFERG